MSGGSLNYVFGRINDAIRDIELQSNKPLHKAFCKHLGKVSAALHDLEWVLSGDMSEPDEEPAIRSCITKKDEINSALEDAKQAVLTLQKTIEHYEVEAKK